MLAYIADTRGTALLHQGETHDAEEYYRAADGHKAEYLKATGLPAPTANEPGLIGINVHLGDLCRIKSEWVSALAEYNTAGREFQIIGEKFESARINRKIGHCYLCTGDIRRLHNPLEASRVFFSELACQPLESDRTRRRARYELAKTYMLIAWEQRITGDYASALQRCKDADDIAEEYRLRGAIEDTTEQVDQYLLEQAKYNLGRQYVAQRQYDLALVHLEQAHGLATHLDDHKDLGMIYLALARTNLGLARIEWVQARDYRTRHDEEATAIHEIKADRHEQEAARYFRMARNEHERIGNPLRLAITLYRSAQFYEKRHPEEAIRLLEEARDKFRKLSNKFYLPMVLLQLCWMYFRTAPQQHQDLIPLLIKQARREAGQGDDAIDYAYHQVLAQIDLFEARWSIDMVNNDPQGRAIQHSANALLHAICFNRHLCNRIANGLGNGLKNIEEKTSSKDASEFCLNLLTRFKQESESQHAILFLTASQEIDRNDLLKWLSLTAEAVFRHESIPEFDPAYP